MSIDSHASGPDVILIKAHAGAGKSVLLKRIAWDAAREYDRLCLFAEPRGTISVPALQELLNVTKDEIYLFIDNAADRTREIDQFLRTIGPEGAHLTLVMAERLNEWNIFAGAVADYVTDEYEMGYLSAREIDQLVQLLEKHKALGYLEKIAPDQRRTYLAERAGRQLLVALHEATMGTTATYQAVITAAQYYCASDPIMDGPKPFLSNAVSIFTGTTGDIVGGATCYWSPTATQWTVVQQALSTNAAAFPANTGAPSCFVGNRQIVYKTSVATNNRGGIYARAPAFLFIKSGAGATSVIQIP